MAGNWGTETEFELTTLERLRALGYTHAIGAEIAENHREADSEVVFRRILREHLTKRYSHLPAESIDEAVALFARPDGVDPLRRNMAFHAMLDRGSRSRSSGPTAGSSTATSTPIDWTIPTTTSSSSSTSSRSSGRTTAGPTSSSTSTACPLVVFELKNPYSDQPTVEHALNQLGHYRHDIPQLFEFNALMVVSDGVTTLHGMWTATPEWYAPWKSIDGEHVEANTTGSMKTLIEGLFPRTTGSCPTSATSSSFEDRQREADQEGGEVPPVLRRPRGRPPRGRRLPRPTPTGGSASSGTRPARASRCP